MEIADEMPPLDAEHFPFADYRVALVTSDASDTDMSWTTHREALGDWLADFQDCGGTVVQLMFSLCDGNHLSVGGRWEREGRGLLSPGEQDSEPHLGISLVMPAPRPTVPMGLSSGGAPDRGGGGGGGVGGGDSSNTTAAAAFAVHPLLSNVRVLDGGSETFFSLGTVAHHGHTLATWTNRVPLLVVDGSDDGCGLLRKPVEHVRGRGLSIAVNMYPISADSGYATLWPREATAAGRREAPSFVSSAPHRNDAGRLLVNCIAYGMVQGLRRWNNSSTT